MRNLSSERGDYMHKPNVHELVMSLREFFIVAGMPESKEALDYAIKKHEGQKRKDGQPYIIHPLRMAHYAMALGARNDDLFATLLLHDVIEDTGALPQEMPVCQEVRNAVCLLTVDLRKGESKWHAKCRYFKRISRKWITLFAKGIDRYDYLCDVNGNLLIADIEKNVVETKYLLEPMIDQGQKDWPEYKTLLNAMQKRLQARRRIVEANHQLESLQEKEIIKRLKVTPALRA